MSVDTCECIGLKLTLLKIYKTG